MSQHESRDRAEGLIQPVILIGGAILIWAFYKLGPHWRNEQTIPWLILVSATVLVGSYAFRIPGTKGVVTISDIFTFSSLLLFGLPQACITAGLDAFVAARRKTKKTSSLLFSTATMTLSIFVGGQVFFAVLNGISKATLQDVNMAGLFLPLTLMAVSHFLVNSLLVSIAVGLRYQQSIAAIWWDELLWVSIACFTSASTAGMGFLLIRLLGFSAFGITMPILAIIYFSYKIYTEKVDEKHRHIHEIAKVHLSTIECLATAIDAKDQVTHGHIRRVQIYTMEMAKLLGVSALELEGLRAAALLHDIGKLGVPEYILNKPAKLTPKEFEKIKSHSELGAEILSTVEFPYPVIPGVLHHHERWDGKGYPAGLKGEEIPLAARILSLVDFFDALASDRPYRKAMTKGKILQIIREESGKMFDPHLAALFLEKIDSFEKTVQAAETDQPRLTHRQLAEERKIMEAPPVKPQKAVLDQIASANREVMAFYEITRNLGRSLEMSDILDIIGNKLEKLVPFTDLAIYLCDTTTDTLVASHVSGPHGKAFQGHTIQRGRGVSGWALANHRSLINANPSLDFDPEKLQSVSALKSLMVFPLFRGPENLGCISLYSAFADAFTDDHARILEALSEQISEALANVLLYEQTREDSLTDAVTGLPNSRFLHTFAEQELFKAGREGQNLTLLVMDLDDFKKVNDAYGHQAGNQVLTDISKIVRRALRDTDTLARYAGDEFIVIAPRTPLVEGQILAARLQKEIDELTLKLDGVPALRIGLSVGCSCFPDDDQTVEELIARADRRMYENKRVRRLAVRTSSWSTSDMAVEPADLEGLTVSRLIS